MTFIPNLRGLPRPFWVLFVGTLVNRIGGFVLVFLAIYLVEVRSLTTGRAGLIMAAYGLGAMAGGPIGGAISDRVGRRPTLVFSLIGGGASMLLLGHAVSFIAILAAAALTGLLYEMYRPVVSATVADVVQSEDRPRAYGLIYWAVNLGASIAPVLGGFIAAHSYRVLFAGDAATTAAYGLIVWVALPETRPSAVEATTTRRNTLGVIVNDSAFLIFCLLTFAFSVIFFQSFIGLPIDVRAHGISSAGFGGLIALNGVLIVLLQPLAVELIRGRSHPITLASASVLLAVGFGMNAWVTSIQGYAVSVAIWTFGEILFAPAATSFVADMAPPHLRGAYQGGFALAFTTAFAAAPLAGGYVIAHAGARSLWGASMIVGLAVAGGFLILSRHASLTSRSDVPVEIRR